MQKPSYEEWRSNPDNIPLYNDPIQRYVEDTTPGKLLADKLNEVLPEEKEKKGIGYGPLASGVHFLLWIYGIGFLFILTA